MNTNCNHGSCKCEGCQIVAMLKLAIETKEKTIIRLILNQEAYKPTQEDFDKKQNRN